ncbi:MAG TPA: GAF domain-containing sensor histidine kinase [Chloroflexota bacterium]|jgi:signal transduction histidine kinase
MSLSVSDREGERRRQIAEGLRELLAMVNAGRELDAILEYVVSQAVQLLDASAGALYLVEPEGEWLAARAAQGLTFDEVLVRLKIGSPVSGLAVERQRAIVCPDVAAGLDYRQNVPRQVKLEDHGSHIRALKIVDEFDTPDDLDRMQRLAKRYRAMLSVPLLVRHTAFGALTLFYTEPRDVSEEEINLALTCGAQAALIVDNARLHGRAEERLRDIEALYSADEALHRSLRVTDVTNALVDVAISVLKADKAAMMIWDDEHERLVVGTLRGFHQRTIPLLTRSSTGLLARVVVTGEPEVIDDARADPRVAQDVIEAEGIHSFVHVPIKVGDDIFGVFTLSYTQPRRIRGDEVRLLLSLAQRAALAIQNARLYEQAQQAAVLEERQRLARELHDAVTQTLFSASLIAEVLPRLAQRQPEQLGPRLEELQRLNRGALAEMRALLLELRPSSLSAVPLIDLLGQLVEAANARSAARFELRVHGEAFPLLAEAQVTLYRLVQEALNNVGKHAQASNAEVEVNWAESLLITVRDDGCGFDTRAVSAGHLGLHFMAERASAIGATLDVESAPGDGTTVRIILPRG